jgi:hypothetical protein
MLEQLKKAQTDKEETTKDKKVAEERTRAEIKQRERLQIENHSLLKQLNSLNSNQASG